eukprot:gnl/Chilomastix_cuspidata/4464.p1 GENE.gnl/Chilomastix_cuspidata/4464~~gnl/Chilomastix_cuspidata/4464.p1  ORF type:complete len:1256 (-),score=418.79 gnl/Chilomastix_cuspidata/4464:286-4053(-)
MRPISDAPKVSKGQLLRAITKDGMRALEMLLEGEKITISEFTNSFLSVLPQQFKAEHGRGVITQALKGMFDIIDFEGGGEVTWPQIAEYCLLKLDPARGVKALKDLTLIKEFTLNQERNFSHLFKTPPLAIFDVSDEHALVVTVEEVCVCARDTFQKDRVLNMSLAKGRNLTSLFLKELGYFVVATTDGFLVLFSLRGTSPLAAVKLISTPCTLGFHAPSRALIVGTQDGQLLALGVSDADPPPSPAGGARAPEQPEKGEEQFINKVYLKEPPQPPPLPPFLDYTVAAPPPPAPPPPRRLTISRVERELEANARLAHPTAEEIQNSRESLRLVKPPERPPQSPHVQFPGVEVVPVGDAKAAVVELAPRWRRWVHSTKVRAIHVHSAPALDPFCDEEIPLVVTASSSGEVCVLSLDGRIQFLHRIFKTGLVAGAQCGRFSLFFGHSHNIAILDSHAPGAYVVTREGNHEANVRHVAPVAENVAYSLCVEGHLKFWHIPTRRCFKTMRLGVPVGVAQVMHFRFGGAAHFAVGFASFSVTVGVSRESLQTSGPDPVVAVAAANSAVAVLAANRVQHWDLRTGALKREFAVTAPFASSAGATAFCFGPRAQKAFVGTESGEVLLLNFRMGTVNRAFSHPHRARVVALAYDAKRALLVSLDEHGGARVYRDKLSDQHSAPRSSTDIGLVTRRIRHKFDRAPTEGVIDVEQNDFFKQDFLHQAARRLLASYCESSFVPDLLCVLADPAAETEPHTPPARARGVQKTRQRPSSFRRSAAPRRASGDAARRAVVSAVSTPRTRRKPHSDHFIAYSDAFGTVALALSTGAVHLFSANTGELEATLACTPRARCPFQLHGASPCAGPAEERLRAQDPPPLEPHSVVTAVAFLDPHPFLVVALTGSVLLVFCTERASRSRLPVAAARLDSGYLSTRPALLALRIQPGAAGASTLTLPDIHAPSDGPRSAPPDGPTGTRAACGAAPLAQHSVSAMAFCPKTCSLVVGESKGMLVVCSAMALVSQETRGARRGGTFVTDEDSLSAGSAAPATLELLRAWKGHNGRVLAVEPAGATTFLTAGEDRSVHCWDTDGAFVGTLSQLRTGDACTDKQAAEFFGPLRPVGDGRPAFRESCPSNLLQLAASQPWGHRDFDSPQRSRAAPESTTNTPVVPRIPVEAALRTPSRLQATARKHKQTWTARAILLRSSPRSQSEPPKDRPRSLRARRSLAALSTPTRAPLMTPTPPRSARPALGQFVRGYEDGADVPSS